MLASARMMLHSKGSQLLYWSKLENYSLESNAELAPRGTPDVSDIYNLSSPPSSFSDSNITVVTAMKFGNGISLYNASRIYPIQIKIRPFGENIVNMNSGTISVWVNIKNREKDYVSGWSKSGACIHIGACNLMTSSDSNNREKMIWGSLAESDNGFQVSIHAPYSNVGSYSNDAYIRCEGAVKDSNTSMPQGMFHLFIVWDKYTFDGSNTIKVYKNNVEILTTDYEFSDISLEEFNIILGAYTEGTDGITYGRSDIDNLKIWDKALPSLLDLEWNDGDGREGL